MGKIRLMVVDDHEIVRLGLRHLLEQYPDLEVVADAGSQEEALFKASQYLPEIVIMDIRLRNGNGIEACREICQRFSQCKVIILTSFGEEETVMEAILAGAKGYILKDVGNEEIIRAIRAVHRGESLLDTVVTRKLLESMRQREARNKDVLEQLTEQEKRVLLLLAEGKTNREIARQVFLSEKTVRNYVSNILAKLNLSNRTEAAAFVARKNLRVK